MADVGTSTRELFAAPVESTCALARLGKVDPAPALKLPGVVAFVGMCLFSCLLPLSQVCFWFSSSTLHQDSPPSFLPVLLFIFFFFISPSLLLLPLFLCLSILCFFLFAFCMLDFQTKTALHLPSPAALISEPIQSSASASSVTISSYSFLSSLCKISSFVDDACDLKLPGACLLHC